MFSLRDVGLLDSGQQDCQQDSGSSWVVPVPWVGTGKPPEEPVLEALSPFAKTGLYLSRVGPSTQCDQREAGRTQWDPRRSQGGSRGRVQPREGHANL